MTRPETLGRPYSPCKKSSSLAPRVCTFLLVSLGFPLVQSYVFLSKGLSMRGEGRLDRVDHDLRTSLVTRAAYYLAFAISLDFW